jgi:NAD(P)-dependent dehydrogenase (short-subunit alcohol dehydrogenase family)
MVAVAIAQGAVEVQGVVDHTPAGRWALPEDIAGAALLLCSPAGRFVTGQAIVVDGGYSLFGAAHAASRRFED